MTSPSRRTGRLRVALAVLGLGLSFAEAAKAADGPPSNAKAEAAWKRLLPQIENDKTDRDRLREALLGFRREHPGTVPAGRASELLASLPSPLDKLDAERIPSLDRFDFQPKQLVAVLGEHRGRQGNTVICVAYSPNGKLVASASANSQVRLWDPATLRQRDVLGGYTVAFDRESKRLVAGNLDGSVHVYDATEEKPKELVKFQASSAPTLAVAFSPDGKRLATGSRDFLVRVWDLTVKEPKKLAELAGHSKDISSVAFSPDGKLVASGSHDKTVILWDVSVEPAQKRALLESHTSEVTGVAFAPDGRTLASAGYDGVTRLWSLLPGPKPRERAVLKGQGGLVYGIAFRPDGLVLAAASADHNVHLWDVGSGKERSVLRGHVDPVAAVAFGPEGRTLVSGSHDWTVRLWDLAGPKPRERFPTKGHLSHVYTPMFGPDGRTLASPSIDRSVRLWTLAAADPRARTTIKGDSYAYCVAYSPDGKVLAAGYHQAIIRLLDPNLGRETGVLKDNPTYVTRLAFTPDNRRLLAASLKELLLWDVSRRKELQRYKGHETYINDMVLSPDGRTVLTATGTYLYNQKGEIVVKDGKNQFNDCTLRLFDAANGDMLTTAKGFTDPFQCLAFFPNGRQAVSGSGGYDSTSRFWSVNDAALKETKALKGQYGPVQLLAVSPDGQRLVTMGPDGKLIEWDPASGKRLWEWAPQEYIGGLAFAPDSRHLAVGLGTGPIYILRLGPPPVSTTR